MPKDKKNKTQILSPTVDNITLCAKEIKAGQVVAFGTETVYGLGADVFNSKAVKRIFDVKGRPGDNPLIVHISSHLQIRELAYAMPDCAFELAKKFMPGPLTMVLKKTAQVSGEVTAGLNTVAVRMPKNKAALDFITECGYPLAAPSANISGFVSPTTAQHVKEDLDGRIGYILDTGACRIGLESTVIDLSDNIPTILRQGAITAEQIKQAIGKVVAAGSVGGEGNPKSPGMKYNHYAPKAKVLFSSFHAKMSDFMCEVYDRAVEKGKNPVILCLEPRKGFYGKRKKHLVGKNLVEYARNLYSALRDIDTDGFDTVIAEGVPGRGIGSAIINRLMKASGNNII